MLQRLVTSDGNQRTLFTRIFDRLINRSHGLAPEARMSDDLPKKLRRLDDFLCRLELDDDAMLLSELDGFLAGIVVCPDLILPSEWMPEIWGENGPAFDDERQAKDILDLIMGHYNDIIRRLGRGSYRPVYDIDVNGSFIWELWMAGFGRALSLSPESWLDLGEDEDEEIQRALFIVARLTELSTRPANEIEPMEIDEALEESAPDLIPECVDILHQARLAKASANTPQASDNPKVGRNDPCPCGSGKKFKRCCLN